MDATTRILSSLPPFRHCLKHELMSLRSLGLTQVMKRGERFDAKKAGCLAVIARGLFAVEAAGAGNVTYSAPGSFFGPMPFADTRSPGKVTAVTDSELILFETENLVRFFLSSYRCLRGYLKIIGKLGFELSAAGRDYLGGQTKVITVVGHTGGSGVSLFASALASRLAGSAKTVVIDCSVGGAGPFDYFEKKMTVPLAQRVADNKEKDRKVAEWIESVNGGPDLLNLAHGIKVKVDPNILAPILFVLSRTYRYIVIDCGGEDPALRDRIFSLSDHIFVVLKNKKERAPISELLDAKIAEGQRVYYILNEHLAGPGVVFEGGFRISSSGESYGPASMRNLADDERMASITALLTRRRRGLVFETGCVSSIPLAGFLDALRERGEVFDVFYSSAYGHIIMALSLLSEGSDPFRRRIVQFFSQQRFGKLLDITFPDEHIFRNDAVRKAAAEMCGDIRLEMLPTLPAVMLCRKEASDRRIVTVGYLKDTMAASFCISPLFEDVTIRGEGYHSGYPDAKVMVEDLFRLDIDETVYVSAGDTRFRYQRGSVIGFFARYLSTTAPEYDASAGTLADARYLLDLQESQAKVGRLFDEAKKQGLDLMLDRIKKG